MNTFALDLQKIRERARSHMEEGAVTPNYKADRETVLKMLNGALATEIVCVLRYQRHYQTAKGIHAEAVKAEFLEHAKEEQAHADLIAERINQLGGMPNYNPEGLLSRSHAEYSEATDLIQMIKDNLVAERIAIETYGEMVRYLGTDDSTTRRLFEHILEQEEEHADDMANFLENLTNLK